MNLWHRLLIWGLLMSSLAARAQNPTVLIEEDPSLMTSSIQVLVRSGAVSDPEAKAGLTSVMAELLLRGTKNRDRSHFQSEIERMGASLSVSVSHDVIAFTGKVIRENTGKFLSLLEDCLLNPAFSSHEFLALKTELLADIRDVKNSNMRLSGLALRKKAFSGTPLKFSVVGGLSTVKKITLADVKKAYAAKLRRGNLVFAAATPIKGGVLQEQFQKIWNSLPEGETIPQASIVPKIPQKPELILIHKPRTSTGALILGQAGITASEPDRYILSVGNFAFGSEPLVSRLFRVVRSQLGWTYSVGSSYHAMGGLSNQQGLFVISSTPSVEFTVKSILKMMTLWEEFVDGGLKADELKLARESLVNSYPFEFDSPEKRLWQRLYSYLYNVPVLSPEKYAATINAVTNKDIIKAVQKHQTNQGWIITLVADKNIIKKQLQEEQKDIPKDKRLEISTILNPKDLIE